MSTCGSFSPDSYSSFVKGIQNPSDFGSMNSADRDQNSSYKGESEEMEPNGRMAMGELRSMASDIMAILSEVTPDDYLEPWVAAKITVSKQNLSAVADYLRFNDDYSEEVYDYKRCVTPGGEYYGVSDNEKCAPPNREAGGKKPPIPGFEDWKNNSSAAKLGGYPGRFIRAGDALKTVPFESTPRTTEWFQFDNPPNSYRTWYREDAFTKWKPMGMGV